MEKDDSPSVFSEYYATQPFVDRFDVDRSRAVDVIIPIIHTNELWRANLISIYREIPVNRLLLGDGGCIDDSLDIAGEFPRVTVLDHRAFVSLGYSLRHLIAAVETEWFVYLHSDVYLPPAWFDTMCSHQGDYDWFECSQRITLLVDYLADTTSMKRAYSGSQMGRKNAFEKVTPLIDDDYLYRNEDIILAYLIGQAGFRYGKVDETYHYHQVMHKPSRWRRGIKYVSIEADIAADEDIRATSTYAKGIIKYMDPGETSPEIVRSAGLAVDKLVELKATTREEFRDWVEHTNAAWLPSLPNLPAATPVHEMSLPKAEWTAQPVPVVQSGTDARLLPLAHSVSVANSDHIVDRMIRFAIFCRERGTGAALRAIAATRLKSYKQAIHQTWSLLIGMLQRFSSLGRK
jgi:hypothetical protein